MRIMMMAAAGLAALGSCGSAAPDRYAEGQVWEYEARASDTGSLIKIQRIEDVPAGDDRRRVYHISVTGARLTNPRISGTFPHLPVSRETLDGSVTRLSKASADFPPMEMVDQGIAEWRAAQGGVFTISVAKAVQMLDDQTRAIGD